MSEKPLMNYTLAETREICGKSTCKECIFGKVKRPGVRSCNFWSETPRNWRFIGITSDDRELLRLTGAKFVSRDWNSEMVDFWGDKPNCVEVGWGKEFANATLLCSLSAGLFSAVPPGVCLSVSDLLGEGEQTDG